MKSGIVRICAGMVWGSEKAHRDRDPELWPRQPFLETLWGVRVLGAHAGGPFDRLIWCDKTAKHV